METEESNQERKIRNLKYSDHITEGGGENATTINLIAQKARAFPTVEKTASLSRRRSLLISRKRQLLSVKFCLFLFPPFFAKYDRYNNSAIHIIFLSEPDNQKETCNNNRHP